MTNQDFSYSTENEDPELCEHRFVGRMNCAYCDWYYEGEDLEMLIAEVLTLRDEVQRLRTQLGNLSDKPKYSIGE